MRALLLSFDSASCWPVFCFPPPTGDGGSSSLVTLSSELTGGNVQVVVVSYLPPLFFSSPVPLDRPAGSQIVVPTGSLSTLRVSSLPPHSFPSRLAHRCALFPPPSRALLSVRDPSLPSCQSLLFPAAQWAGHAAAPRLQAARVMTGNAGLQTPSQ